MDYRRYRSVCLSALAFRQYSSILLKLLTKHGTNTNEMLKARAFFKNEIESWFYTQRKKMLAENEKLLLFM